MNKHTEGPWGVSSPGNRGRACYVGVIRAGQYQGDIAELHFQASRNQSEQEANARLISAAPELLRMCRIVLARLDVEAKEKGQDAVFLCAAYREEIREVVAKAQGN